MLYKNIEENAKNIKVHSYIGLSDVTDIFNFKVDFFSIQIFFLNHTKHFQSEFLQSFLDEIDMKIVPVIGKAIKLV